MPNDLTPINRPREAYEVDRSRADLTRAPEVVAQRESAPPSYPLPPENGFVFASGFQQLDLHWDSPALLVNNQEWEFLGVNVYRSFDSEWGPFTKISTIPVGSNFFRDASSSELVTDEDVSERFLSKGGTFTSLRARNLSETPHLGTQEVEPTYMFKVTNFPIVKPDNITPANSPEDVLIRIDGIIVKAFRVFGNTGEVQLNTRRWFNPVTQRLEDPLLPGQSSVVTITYRYNKSVVTQAYANRVFYRLTTVGRNSANEVVETPLDAVKSIHPLEVANLNYIWKEAVRRNRWILEQGGERVKLYIRKWIGPRCPSWSDEHHQSRKDCTYCYGTGVLGGYEGPFEILIAPPDGTRKLAQTPQGFVRVHTYETWTGPSPLISTRDFIRKQNGDIYTIGEVTIPSNAGNVLQQHFPLNLMPETDIRYRIPYQATMAALKYPQTRATDFEGNSNMPQLAEGPMITDDPAAPDERERRQRTVAMENIVSNPNSPKGW